MASQSYIVGITGGSGSGKTTFLDRLRGHFPQSSITIISQDNYYRPKEEQMLDPDGVPNYDLPHAIDHQGLLADVRQLMSGREVVRTEYTFNNAARAGSRSVTLQPAPILLIEGLFVFHDPGLLGLIDLKLYLHAMENLKVIRRIRRDREERNYGLEDVLYRYEKHVIPTFEEYIKPYREKADMVINNNRGFERGLQVVVGFLAHRLSNMPPSSA